MSLIMSDPILRRMLMWLAQRFGRVNSRGVSLSFDAMNLTHRHLAALAGVTRVKVTKTLSHLRQEGVLISDGADALLRLDRCSEMQWLG